MFYAARKTIKIWDVNSDIIVISKLTEKKKLILSIWMGIQIKL